MAACKKNSNSAPATGGATTFAYIKTTVNDNPYTGSSLFNAPANPTVEVFFSQPIDKSTVAASVSITGGTTPVTGNFSYPSDTALIIKPSTPLQGLTNYTITISSSLKSVSAVALNTTVKINLTTGIDSSDKFPAITDSALLTLVEQQTFKYFWDLGDPTSGLARERFSDQTTVTTGGSGFGIMSMLVGVQRNFITRADALSRITTIVNFLTNKCSTYHGAFSHWINGTTGATIPFGTQDNGGDIVETSYMLQGLLCARQYFNSATDPGETNLRNAINTIYNKVDWTWYRQNGQNTLYWNWSPNYNFAINVQVGGWDEALITYVMAASSTIDSSTIPKIVYDNGWAHNGAMKNGKSFYGIPLPLGPDYGGPLFFTHYSFLGINPHGLSDAYANYWTQDTAHARINYLYCVNNPKKYNGYSNLCWGLTASDEQSGYSAHAPNNDDGVISPTAAISSLPYTPTESMNALRFFYYKLGDKIWKQYGFVDAFNLTNIWYDTDFLAIDQGPQIVMIENYRTGLLWNLFMSCPEIKAGMTKLGFQGPNL
ncbi:MAG TPA: glucoamylase family protein [Puia sp.]